MRGYEIDGDVMRFLQQKIPDQSIRTIRVIMNEATNVLTLRAWLVPTQWAGHYWPLIGRE